MDPTTYQALCARTECVQENSLIRMRGYGGNNPSPCENTALFLVPIRLNHAVIGLGSEAGELMSLVQKWIYYGKFAGDAVADAGCLPVKVRDNVAEEIGDVLWYAALACNAAGLSLQAVMEANIAKLRVRYPQKYTDLLAAEENRDRKAEAEAIDEKRLVAAIKAAEDGEKYRTRHCVPGVRPPEPKYRLPRGNYTCGCPFTYEVSGQNEPMVVGFCDKHNHPMDNASVKTEDIRTPEDVLRQRKNAVGGGCCERFADQQGCDCLSEAEKRRSMK